MNKNETSRIIEATLNSVNSINKSVPDDVLFQKIMSDVSKKENSFLKNNSNTGKYALALAVLIFINIFSFFNYKSMEEDNSVNYSLYNSKQVNSFVKEFFSETYEYNYNK